MGTKRRGTLSGLLESAGLVRFTEQDQQAEESGDSRPASEAVVGAVPASPPPPAATVAPVTTAGAAVPAAAADQAGASQDIPEKVPFEQLYADAGVPAGPFPAERMLKVLGGMRAMSVDVRRTAVLAMDEADDSWKIDDVLADAAQKIGALHARRDGLGAKVQEVVTAAQSEISERETRQQRNLAQIRQQITELQALMEREVEAGTRDKHALEARVQAAQAAVQREIQRMDEEIARLQEIPNTFGALGQQPATAPGAPPTNTPRH